MLETVAPRAHLHAVDGAGEPGEATRGEVRELGRRQAPVPTDSFETISAGPERTGGARVWAAVWPKLAAALLALLVWELVVLSGWRPDYVLPGPAAVFGRLLADTLSGEVLVAAAITMKRALLGYAIALAVGVTIGLLMARVKVLRTAAGSLLTGLQTMPSVAWFPLAILLFQLSEAAILAVVVLGARGLGLYRHIILPAALPGFITGLKQGWAFAWRSLMAGELLVIIGHAPSIGVRLQFSRELSDAEGLLAWMIVVMILGVLVDGLVFGALERSVHRRRGLTGVQA